VSGKVPPSSRAGRSRQFAELRTKDARRAARIFERFTGHECLPIDNVDVPPLPKAVAIIGHCDGILYTTVRDGREERYVHDFAMPDRPLLGISPDGKQILLIDGNYDFTDRGIVDASDYRTRKAMRRR